MGTAIRTTAPSTWPPGRIRRRSAGTPGLALLLASFVVALLISSPPTTAGTNEGGMLVLHVATDMNFTQASRDGEDRNLRDCAGAVTSIAADEQPVVVFLLAAFPDWAQPRISGIQFGIDHSTQIVDHGLGRDYEDFFTLETTDWPASFSGNAIATGGRPIEDRLSTVYWFAAYAYNGTSIEIIEHPSQGEASFGDDSIPAQRDQVDRDARGKIGFGVEGYNPCLVGVPTGACCYLNGTCQVGVEATCELQEGTYRGDDSVCDPFACYGACCIEGDCFQELPNVCERQGGWFRGVGRSCSGTACLSEEVTWGELKRSYREQF